MPFLPPTTPLTWAVAVSPLIFDGFDGGFEAVDLFELRFERPLAASGSGVQFADAGGGEVFGADLLRFERCGVALQARDCLGDLLLFALEGAGRDAAGGAAGGEAAREQRSAQQRESWVGSWSSARQRVRDRPGGRVQAGACVETEPV